MLTTRGYDNYSNLLGRVLEPVLKIESSRGEYHFFCLSIFESSTRLLLKLPSESSFEFSSFLHTLTTAYNLSAAEEVFIYITVVIEM